MKATLTEKESLRNSAELIGARIGDYELLQEIGRGAYSCVYQACDLRSGDFVALKLFSAPRPGDGFVREAGVGFEFNHPNLLTALDLGYADAQTRYVTYQLAEGGSLRGRMKDGIVTTEFARHAITEIARGLSALHAKAIVHRDLKPENILFSDDCLFPRLCLADLGTSDCVRNDNARGQGGSPAYIAPEQINGECDTRADIYALGVIAVELLSGKRPFTGMIADVLHGHLQKTPNLAGLDFNVGDVLYRALAKNPNERYATVYEFACAFDRALSTSEDRREIFFNDSPEKSELELAHDPLSGWSVIRKGEAMILQGLGAPAGQYLLGKNGVAAVSATSPIQMAGRDDRNFIAGIGERTITLEAPLYGLPPIVALRRFAGDVVTIEGGASSTLMVMQSDGTVLSKISLPFQLSTLQVVAHTQGEFLIGIDVQRQFLIQLTPDHPTIRPTIVKAPEMITTLGICADQAWIQTTANKCYDLKFNQTTGFDLALKQ